ncbi:hypothetical protein C8J57DRAFT_1724200 [Mycena rebaudengoi]|nr:hypothetical protein C8J57DRAFT_1724200 [Mycena rebaudengoi]
MASGTYILKELRLCTGGYALHIPSEDALLCSICPHTCQGVKKAAVFPRLASVSAARALDSRRARVIVGQVHPGVAVSECRASSARTLTRRQQALAERKLEDDEAAEPKELEHPHKLPRPPAAARLHVRRRLFIHVRHSARRHRRAHAVWTPWGPPRLLDCLHTADAAAHADLLALKSVFLSKPALATAHAWRTLRALKVESELDAYKLDGLKALLLLHVQAAAFVSFVAFLGVLRPPTYACTVTAPSYSPPSSLYSPCTSPIALPASLDTLLALLPNPFSSASSSSSSGSSAYARLSDGAGAASMNPLRLACDQPELAGLLALTAPGEACERWLKRAAVSVSAGMLHFLLAVLAQYAHMLCSAPSAPTPSADGADAEQGAAPLSTLSTLSTPTHMHIFPLPPHLSPNDVVYVPVHVGVLSRSIHDAVGDKSAYGEKKEVGSSLVSRATEVWVSATRLSGASTRRVRERGNCRDMRDRWDTREGPEGRERQESGRKREGRADAGLLDADVVGPYLPTRHMPSSIP